MMVMMSEGGESKYDTNINFLLEEFGIMVNSGLFDLQFSVSKFRANAASSTSLSSRVKQIAEPYRNISWEIRFSSGGLLIPVADSVIRTIFYKYFHPKEALVSNGVLNRSLAHAAGKVVKGSLDDDENNAQ